MTLDDLIEQLKDARKSNGNMNINVCVDGRIFLDVEINCVEDTLYIEGYRQYGLESGPSVRYN